MPIYKAPVDDAMFLLNDVFQISRYNNLPGFADATPDLIEAVLGEAAKLAEEVMQPVNRSGDEEGCTRHDDGSVTTPEGIQGSLPAICRGRLDGHFGAGGIRRPGPAGDDDHHRQRVHGGGQHGAHHVSGPDAGRDRGDPHARHAGAEGRLSAEDDRGQMDRHHEPHGAALRHRSRPAAHQGGQAGRRQLQDHRHQDLHLGRRARPRREHRASRAGAHRGRARRHPRHVAVHRAEIPAERRRLARARATPSPAARSKRRWASTATPPAS